jgi:hypothetical protein
MRTRSEGGKKKDRKEGRKGITDTPRKKEKKRSPIMLPFHSQVVYLSIC